MNQSTSASVANLQLHHNFRWVLCSPHTEPVRGFLSRYLRRRLISAELETGLRDSQLERVVSWLPTVLERVNKFLENQCSSELTIGTSLTRLTRVTRRSLVALSGRSTHNWWSCHWSHRVSWPWTASWMLELLVTFTASRAPSKFCPLFGLEALASKPWPRLGVVKMRAEIKKLFDYLVIWNNNNHCVMDKVRFT